MCPNYDFLQVLTIEIAAILLILGMLWVSRGKVNGEAREAFFIKLISYLLIFDSLMDIPSRIFDGMPGNLARMIVIATTYGVFIVGFTVGITAGVFIIWHVYGYIPKRYKWMMGLVSVVVSGLIVGNLFNSKFFFVDSSNTYHAGPLFWLYAVLNYSFLIVAVIQCMREQTRKGTLEFFSPVLFALPLLIGTILQAIFPRVTAEIAFESIMVAYLMYSLQNEMLYRDKLTGLYNRFYIDQLLKRLLKKKRNIKITALMLDLNHFKPINDNYGHGEGDLALKEMARILTEVTVGKGKATRYAGDEFVVLLYDQDENQIQSYKENLQKKLDDYNRNSGKPYQLSTAIGGSAIDASIHTTDEIMNIIDEKMYQNKKEYYDQHPAEDRRHASRQ